ncbi:dCTP pyrophosphatase 1 [Pelobates cultripes]|uniref:dCTP pyrophosphatase 1 n=1 Tax=Pelobates cultripes TaxID=61616 RepID=A0AAD1WJ12_PELCU|nr:dCTP pyrophosphatase 1 [Pelobates cultripes]
MGGCRGPVLSGGWRIWGRAVEGPHNSVGADTTEALTATGCLPSEFRFSSSPTMENIRQLQAQFTRERDWNRFHQPRNLLLALVGEVGELSELFQWQGEVAEGLPGWSESQREALSHELSDVLIYLLELAEKCRVDLPQAVLAKMELNAKKYPASRVHGSAKKYTEYNADNGACSSTEPGLNA